MGFRRRKNYSLASITLLNGKALPESLKEAGLNMSVSSSICAMHSTGTPFLQL